jgi:hypothetical protein
MSLKNILYFSPRLFSFRLRELADSLGDRHPNPDLESAALFRAELSTVFPDTICVGH